jgi:hypothetical protein
VRRRLVIEEPVAAKLPVSSKAWVAYEAACRLAAPVHGEVELRHMRLLVYRSFWITMSYISSAFSTTGALSAQSGVKRRPPQPVPHARRASLLERQWTDFLECLFFGLPGGKARQGRPAFEPQESLCRAVMLTLTRFRG